MNGKEFLTELRKINTTIPVLVLTSNSLVWDKVDALDIGADDYLTKPFEMDELLARTRALTRRKWVIVSNEVCIWDVSIDMSHGKVFLGWNELEMSAKEYKIIAFLTENRSFSKTKEEILEAVWWEKEEFLPLSSTTLETHISGIRKKLGKDFIKTNRNIGYVIE
jgi:DNA-binding response OmpR family regulator